MDRCDNLLSVSHQEDVILRLQNVPCTPPPPDLPSLVDSVCLATLPEMIFGYEKTHKKQDTLAEAMLPKTQIW